MVKKDIKMYNVRFDTKSNLIIIFKNSDFMLI